MRVEKGQRVVLRCGCGYSWRARPSIYYSDIRPPSCTACQKEQSARRHSATAQHLMRQAAAIRLRRTTPSHGRRQTEVTS